MQKHTNTNIDQELDLHIKLFVTETRFCTIWMNWNKCDGVMFFTASSFLQEEVHSAPDVNYRNTLNSMVNTSSMPQSTFLLPFPPEEDFRLMLSSSSTVSSYNDSFEIVPATEWSSMSALMTLLSSFSSTPDWPANWIPVTFTCLY